MRNLLFLLSVCLVTFVSCGQVAHETQNKKNMDTTYAYTNHLIHESSPYLLQHAHNPVDWYPWGNEALQKAKKEHKLLLISIGYAACHWCHVMEHECFEDTTVARIMNDNFVCIKVDREERPDIDQIYMNAVQLMTGQGGWPLNCIALPDGRPIFGGTYFPKKQWMETLLQVAHLYQTDSEKVYEYATHLMQGIKQSDLVHLNTQKPELSVDTLKNIYAKWKTHFDTVEGGPNYAPKFPLPNNYEFLLDFYHLTKDKTALKQVELTLNKMAFGGIYDQLGGGFARYSTDSFWKIPHFEKMLYDNAQLVSLYSKAFQVSKNPLYKQVVYETLNFIQRDMTAPSGAFYSSLDADSDDKEGAYYVWTRKELKSILGDQYKLFADYYNVNSYGHWEGDDYILMRKHSDEDVAKQHDLTTAQLDADIKKMKQTLLAVREKRVHPALDDKSLTSWNALMLNGYVDAYRVFDEPHFLKAALKNAHFIVDHQLQKDGSLLHNYKNGKSDITGYLDDYAFTIQAFINLYQATFDAQWLNRSDSLMEYTLAHFQDAKSQLFYFTSDKAEALITRKMEVSDNVIPASNSAIARDLFILGHYYDKENYIQTAQQMLNNVKDNIASYPSGYSNWGILYINYVAPFYEVAISGKDAQQKRKELDQYFIPNKLIAGSEEASQLPLLQDRYVKGETFIYVCKNKSCQLPVKQVKAAAEQMK